MTRTGSPGPPLPLSATDYHVLMVLAEEDLYGYAIMKGIEVDSRGAVSPEIGSLYRILARLMTALVHGSGSRPDPPSPGEDHATR